jgi:multiple sugar transport system ATP-binding protein
MTMADKIVVLNGGIIEQVGSPLELYRSPANLFVAGFIGSPRMNFIHGGEAEKLGATTIGIRPEHLSVSTSPRDGAWQGRVSVAEHLGADTFVHVNAGALGNINVRTGGEVSIGHGDVVYLTPDSARVHRFNTEGQSMAA